MHIQKNLYFNIMKTTEDIIGTVPHFSERDKAIGTKEYVTGTHTLYSKKQTEEFLKRKKEKEKRKKELRRFFILIVLLFYSIILFIF